MPAEALRLVSAVIFSRMRKARGEGDVRRRGVIVVVVDQNIRGGGLIDGNDGGRNAQ